MRKYIYFFSQEKTEGGAEMKNLLGGKGANLAQMARLGIPIPPGFTISTEACIYFYKNNQNYPKGLEKELKKNLAEVEKVKGAKFGDKSNPLLFSIRSGARVSMPGMMDTVLNLGLNDEIVKNLTQTHPRFAWNSYWRFIFMFADVVMGVKKEELDKIKGEDCSEKVERLKTKIKHLTGREMPQDPQKQLWQAVSAVFKSWNNPRAITYRKLNRIPDDWGTAVNIQSMVFGNLNDNSGSGVGFTRNPATGEKKLYGEFLPKVQGEDVVAGIRTPYPIEQLKKISPRCYQEILKISETLEKFYKDMQDIEFTIESGKLWMLQTRTGKRAAQAAIKMALDMNSEKLINKSEAILRIDPKTIEGLFRPSFDPKVKKEILAKGLAASPGAAVGEAVFDPGQAEELVKEGHKVILVRTETSAGDIHGMAASEGILTARGGQTSHAALVARGMGKPCIVGCEAIYVDYKNEFFWAGDKKIQKGDIISIDGGRGLVFLGKIPTIPSKVSGELEQILELADEIRKLQVYTNADTSFQAKQARDLGAEGIGLCRTEHMFFEENRIGIFQQMILAKDKKARELALQKILPLQKGDFLEIFKMMEGLPVIIRLLDPPLHEFLPKKNEDVKKLAKSIGISFKELEARVETLKELNPMLGHRGVRLGVTFPEIYEMQTRAIMEAGCRLAKRGKKVIPEIMIPLTLGLEEFKFVKELVKKVCEEIIKKFGIELVYKIGTMIELPRAALQAGEIAKQAEFFSFGTNDLTQTTLGISRDDAGRFLPAYLEKKIFKDDPFVVLDENGVGELIKICKERARLIRPGIEIGICGEHGGDPESIEFCHKIGLDYVSCSPLRIPVARLAAAQAVLKNKDN